MTTAASSTAVAAAGWGIWRVPERCPGCAAERLHPVFDGENANFLCQACNRCWHVRMGWLQRVNPLTCPGCEWRGSCTSRWDVIATQMGPDRRPQRTFRPAQEGPSAPPTAGAKHR